MPQHWWFGNGRLRCQRTLWIVMADLPWEFEMPQSHWCSIDRLQGVSIRTSPKKGKWTLIVSAIDVIIKVAGIKGGTGTIVEYNESGVESL